MNPNMTLIGATIVLLVITYINTIRDQKEPFASPTIPEFNFKSLSVHNKACKAAIETCNTPFCIDFKSGKGPLMDCTNEYLAYFSKKNGLIPTY